MKKAFFTVFVLLPVLACGKGLVTRPSFFHLSTDEGLSSSTTNDICIDNKGVVWITSKDGLNSFNGKSVDIFRPNPSFEDSKVGNSLGRAAYDGEDKLYLVASDYLSVFDRKKLEFKNIPCKNIGSITYHGRLYVSTQNIITRYSDADDCFEPVISLKEGLSVSALTFRGDSLWIGTKQDGVYLSVGGADPVKVLDAGKVTDIYCDSGGCAWVCTWTRGLFRIRPDGKVDNYRNSSSDNGTVSSDFVRTCCEDGNGNIWIGSIKGIDRLDAATGRISRIRSTTGTRDALSNNSIWKMCRDRQGNIWVATYYGGVNCFNPEVELFTCYYPSPYQDGGLTSPIVGRIYGDGPDGLWIATEAGFNHFDKTSGKFVWYGINSDGDAVLEHVKALYHDKPKGIMWVGADMGGLFRVNLDSGDIRAYYNDPDNPFTIPGNRVRDIIPYKNDSLVVATQSGICVFSMVSGKCRRILSKNKSINVVTDISFSPDGQLWIVDSEGLYRYDMESGKITCCSGGSLPEKFVSCTFFDSKGGTWVGTYDSGLFRYNADTDTFRHFHLSGLSVPCINSIGEIPSTGHLVLSTSSGICILDPESSSVRNYDSKRGFPFRSTGENSLFISEDETIFLGSNQGMVSFCSENIFRKPRRFDIIPDKVRINGNEIVFQEDVSSISTKRGASVTIELSTTNFIPSDIVNLEYNLSNSNEWTAVGVENTIELSELKAGKYILTVRDRTVPDEVCPALVIKISAGVRFSAILFPSVVFLLIILIFLLVRHRRSFSENIVSEEDLTPSQRLCKKAREIVEANIANSDFGIAAFGFEMGMSRTVLFQKIKEATDKTPNDFITGIRLERAAEMLEKNLDLNISDIAEKTGFGSSAYFSQKFKEAYHVSPLAYRKKNHNI